MKYILDLRVKFIILILLITAVSCCAQSINNENKRPKVGLVLSGGGAKGLAHIGLLRLIDSLGIKIDYITGTSMGGVLGGLYAMGYSADQLDSIATHMNWKRILRNEIPLNEVDIVEKDEYGQYALSLPANRLKPGLPSALIEGQKLSEIFNSLTFPVRDIHDFSKLPIPLKVTTTDIVTGERILQTQGSLPLALRATMSIPGVFSMTYIDGNPYVDGGLARNFPVEEVREMGADVVIGGYTGFRLYVKQEVQQPLKMIVQTQAFGSVEDSKKQMDKTDILVNFNEALTGFGPADFTKNKEIIAAGKKKAQQILTQLEHLKSQQLLSKTDTIKSEHLVKNISSQKYVFISEDGDTIRNQKELAWLHSKWNLELSALNNVKEVNGAVDRLYATQYYDKVYYTYSSDDEMTTNVFVKSAPKTTFKAAAHYDTDQSAGVILNYTFRNLLTPHSRFLLTVDAAERFKFRVNYYTLFSKKSRAWLKANVEYRNQKNNDFILSLTSPLADDFNYFNRNLSTFIGAGYAFSRNMMLEGGLLYERENTFRKESLVANILGLENENNLYSHHNLAFVLKLEQQSLDAPYFSRKGNHFVFETKFSFNNSITLNKPLLADSAALAVYSYLDPFSSLYKGGTPGNILRISVADVYAKPISEKVSFIVNGFSSVNYSTKNGMDADNYFYFGDKLAVGGLGEKFNLAAPDFIGLNRQELLFNSVNVLGGALQYNIFKNVYLRPKVNYGWENDSFNILKNIFTSDNMLGYGAHIGYMSIIGPIDFSLSKSSISGIHLPWRVYFSFGFKF